MNTAHPDNYINEELYQRLNNLDVGGINFKLFVGTTGNAAPDNYFLVSTQLDQENTSKCGKGWDNSTEIQIIVKQPKNKGSKKLINNAFEELRQELQDFQLPISSNMNVSKVELNAVNEFIEEGAGSLYYRKIVRLLLTIK